MSTSDADELAPTAPIEIPPSPSHPRPPAEPAPPDVAPSIEDGTVAAPVPVAFAPPPPLPAPEVVYVPLAATIGDGFKLGCGFFLAMVLAMLVGFVLVAALFLLTSAFGLNLPITR